MKLLVFRYDKAAQAQEDTEESLKRRPLSANEPQEPPQVDIMVDIFMACK